MCLHIKCLRKYRSKSNKPSAAVEHRYIVNCIFFSFSFTVTGKMFLIDRGFHLLDLFYCFKWTRILCNLLNKLKLTLQDTLLLSLLYTWIALYICMIVHFYDIIWEVKQKNQKMVFIQIKSFNLHFTVTLSLKGLLQLLCEKLEKCQCL